MPLAFLFFELALLNERSALCFACSDSTHLSLEDIHIFRKALLDFINPAVYLSY